MPSPAFTLDGKTALVTGGGRGIGRAIALAFAEAGARVAVAARTAAEIEAVAALIGDLGAEAIAVPCDVLDSAQVEAMTARVRDRFGVIDILVNNAGGGSVAVPFLDLPEGEWDLHVARNLKTAFLCSQAVGRVMAETGGGNIISISSVLGMGPHPLRAPYSVAKAGVIALTQTLAVELAPHNIRVNAIAPGFIEVPRLLTQFPRYAETVRPARLANIPAARMGEPEDVARLAVFLASDASDYITGQVIRIDGGVTTSVFYKSREGGDSWW